RNMRIDVSDAAGQLEIDWFSPTTGEWQRGAPLAGGDVRMLGAPPFDGDVAAIVAALGADGCTADADCDDKDACNGLERCDGGECVLGTTLRCKDRNPCTTSRCDSEIGCVTEAVRYGFSCDDGVACTNGDVC